MRKKPFIIIGGGLAGLSTATELGEHSLILEKEKNIGGLVQSSQFDGYWYDHVLHLLYFNSKNTENKIKSLLGEILKPVTSTAWVESISGTVKFPMQVNLHGLPVNVVSSCIRDLAETSYGVNKAPENFEEWLLFTFGKSLCDEFFFPYNRKMWSRDLSTLMPTNFQWNITPPNFINVLNGALEENNNFKAYNSNGWYPVPEKNSSNRGMSCLSHCLAKQVKNLSFSNSVKRIDIENNLIFTDSENDESCFKYEVGCIATLPLPLLIKLCDPVPMHIKEKIKKLKWNRVISIAINIQGPRPENMGLWRYYADEALIFTRLIFMHEFDVFSAPDDGWGLLVEITGRAEDEVDENMLIERTLEDINKLSIIDNKCEIKAVNVMKADPAYVAFTSETESIVAEARSYLESAGIYTVGRYARWEYSSMSQVMTDGFELGEKLKSKLAKDAVL
ncbi:hypothetical protein MNBD_GAMMA10-69 [hydrothermal vent metagenome]|uniref:Amine oxidase domain-containing protein n=1 Tax=hydrothermal vent metagenome TaxID=652676 RepID=A0A3B0Y1Y5_9ZZZZ